MAITRVNRVATTSGVTASTINVTANVTSGDLVVVMIQHQGATVSTVTDTIGNTGYAKTTLSPYTTGGGVNRHSIWWCVSTGTNASNVVTVTFAASYNYCTMAVTTAHTDTSTWGSAFITDAKGSGSGSSNTTDTTMSLSSVSSFCVSMGANDTGAPAPTAGSGWSNIAPQDGAGNYFVYDESAITSTDIAGTFTKASTWSVLAAAFQVAGGGGGGSPTFVQLERMMPRGVERGAIH